jgi:hypothetical protein
MNDKTFLLNENDISFIEYFNSSYLNNIAHGSIDGANHCAVAILLHLQQRMGLHDMSSKVKDKE